MHTADMDISLIGIDLPLLLEQIQKELFAGEPPSSLKVDSERREITQSQIVYWAETCEKDFRATWAEQGYVLYDRNSVVRLSLFDRKCSSEDVLRLLAPLTWSTASFSSIHKSWFDWDIRYVAPDFGWPHWDWGWGCAFKGDGHERLTSRRCLNYGPWRLLRGPHDISLVQFHDLGADDATALEQAKPGHQFLKKFDMGDRQLKDFYFENEELLRGLYLTDERQLRIVIADRPVSEREMLEQRAAVYYGLNDSDKPIDSICYVFILEEQAREHLHALWLHGLQCRTFINAREQRIDDSYQPPASVKPEWVRQLEAQQ